MFNELPVFECKNDDTKAMNYFILALTAHKAVAEIIFDRLVNVTIVCQIFKPLVTLPTHKNLNWSYQAIFKLLREFHDLKSTMLAKEESIIGDIKGDLSEERTFKILKWFIHNEASSSPKRSIGIIKGSNNPKRYT